MDKAILRFNMIEKGDRILVCVSGGPDSLCLLHLLKDRLRYRDHPFSFVVLHVDLGFEISPACTTEPLESYLTSLNVDHRILRTNISNMALASDAKKNPCFICSHHRRHQVYKTAHQEKCNKIAYGHHKDDIVETLLINILFGRKIEAMNPVQEVFKGIMHIIRPFTYIEESMLKRYAREAGFPVFARPCPMDGHTRRQKIKEMIADLQKSEKNANIRENIFKSLSHVHIDPYT
jgi:tRNA 2-thiocytidine biosynthesis protein TtcA